jgi:adenylate cyclase
MRTRRLYRNLLFAAALVAVAAGVVTYVTDVLERADLASVDARFDVRGATDPPKDVVIVKIDDRTFDVVKEFPIPRGFHADVIDNLDRAGAKVIAYDVQFTEESGDPDADNRLIEAVRAADGVVLGTSEVGRGGSTRIFGGGEGLEYSRGIAANVLVPNDPGGIVRRMRIEGRGLVSFPVASAEAALGRRVVVPDGRGATPWVDYTGPPDHVRAISFSDVARGRFDRSLVRGKVVVVGAHAVSLQDRQPTSTSDVEDMPGPEIHANAIDTVLRGFPLREGPGWLDVLLILLAGATAPLLSLRAGIVRGMLGSFALLAVAAGAVYVAFDAGLIVSVVYAALAWLIAVLSTIVLNGMTSAFEKEHVRSMFVRFVPESVVEEVLAAADGARLGGVRRETTLLFSDLRGFTSFSEQRNPHLVIECLNRYLTEMSDAILDNGGTLVSYMGDGIMAVFGAPLDQDDHADRAVEAAVEMCERMDGFNAWMKLEGHGEGFKMGIGLNTGPVMAGHVGSERRLEYTTIGDTTNTAARIEGMTKGTPHQLFLSEQTRLALTREHELELVGDFDVRGREAQIRLWTRPGTGVEPVPVEPPGPLDMAAEEATSAVVDPSPDAVA